MADDAISVVKTGSTIAFTGTSANVAMPKDSSGTTPKYIRLASTAACYVKIGASGVSAVAGDLLVQPADSVVLKVGRQATSPRFRYPLRGLFRSARWKTSNGTGHHPAA